ncbi:MAG: glycosyltransferase family 2 protein, partial [Acidimicrobiia bacterium]|nr:glycosyltransferase family 2 protein [Acidimicrobiia bacterium]
MIETPVFINCRDRLEPLQQLLGWLEDMGMQRINLIDNDSTFEPLLDFYNQSSHDVIRLESNLGPRALFHDDRFADTVASQKFIYTDCDILPMGAPSDALELFDSLLQRYPVVDKVGFGLRIDDLPNAYPHADLVREWEGRFWL